MVSNQKGLLASGIVVTLMALLPLANLGNDTFNLLIMLFIYIMLAQSWNLMGGYAGQMNLGLAAFFGCGVVSAFFLSKIGIPQFLAIPAGGVAAIVLACIIGIPSLRLKGMYFSIGTLALAEALEVVISNVLPATQYVSPAVMADFSFIPRYYVSLALAVISTGAVFLIVNSRLGLALLALRDDEDPARVTGINVFKYKVIVFIISSFMAGLAGGVFAYFRLTITPVGQFSPLWTFGPLMAVTVGGVGTIIGPVIGSIFYVIIADIFALTLGKVHLIVFGILFILVIFFLPGGIVEIADKSRKLLARLSGRKKAGKLAQ